MARSQVIQSLSRKSVVDVRAILGLLQASVLPVNVPTLTDSAESVAFG